MGHHISGAGNGNWGIRLPVLGRLPAWNGEGRWSGRILCWRVVLYTVGHNLCPGSRNVYRLRFDGLVDLV